MRIGVIVDGRAEQASLKELFPKLRDARHQFVNAKFAPMDPKSTPAQIVNAALPAIRIHVDSGVRSILLLIDLEDLPACPGDRAQAIWQAIMGIAVDECVENAFVVVKHRTFENWLIADTDALASLTARFDVPDNLARRIRHRADSIDAGRTISGIAIKRSYEKVNDSIRILRVADPVRMAANSRSFGKLLRIAEHPQAPPSRRKQ